MPQRREQRERRRRHSSHGSRHYDEKKGRNTLGKVLAVIQLLISVIFIGILFNSGMIPIEISGSWFDCSSAAVCTYIWTSVCKKQSSYCGIVLSI